MGDVVMKRVLFVDDMPGRVERLRFVAAVAGVELDVVHRLHPGEVTDADLDGADVVMLDHDMCQAPPGEDCPTATPSEWCRCPDGQDLARRIIKRRRRMRCVVHSANLAGRAAMVAMLHRAGWPVTMHPVERWHGYAPTALLRAMGILGRGDGA